MQINISRSKNFDQCCAKTSRK